MGGGEGGLNLPSISTLYKSLQVIRQCQLLTSADPTVRHIAEKGLQTELVVQQTLQEDPGHTRRTLSTAATQAVKSEDSGV